MYSGPVPMLGEGLPPGVSSAPAAGAALARGAAVTAGTSGGSTAGPTRVGATTAVPPTRAETPSGPPESTPGGGPAIAASTIACRQGKPCAPVSNTTTPVSVPAVVVTIIGVHLALAWASLLDPSSPDAWLVPVYVFELTGGTAYPFFGDGVPVLALAERYLAAPPSTTVPTGVTKPGTTPTPNSVVTPPAPSATATK